MRLGILAYIVPFVFVISPELLFIGSWLSISVSAVTALLGTLLLGSGLVGYLFRPLGMLRRGIFVCTAAALSLPILPGRLAHLTTTIKAVAVMAAIALVLLERFGPRSALQEAA